MAKFMFVVPPFFGHISPTLSVGATLIEKGHTVIWVGIRDLPNEHIPAGGKFIVPHEALAAHEKEIQHILKRQDDGPSIGGAEVLKLALEETYIPFCRFMMKGLPAIVDEFQPDVIISDCISFAGAICAWNKDIPHVTTTPVPPGVMGNAMRMPKIHAWQQNLITQLQHEFGIYTEKHIVHSDQLNLVFTSRQFAGIENPPGHMKFVGPVKGRPNDVPFDWDRLERSASPRVFVSLGTLLVDIRKAFFQKIIAAFASQPLTIVAATDPDIFPAWPDNFIVQGFVPQSLLMPQMDAVVCHGGFNTVNDALVNGLPILITPITYDHFHTASLIENAKCGIQLRYKRLRTGDLQAAMWNILENEKYHLAAQRIRDSFIRAGGNAAAAWYLEDFAKNSHASRRFKIYE